MLPMGKGSHVQYGHPALRRPVTISGRDGADAKPYQEREVRKAVQIVIMSEHEKK